MTHGYPDFEGNKSRIYSVAEWAALEGKELVFDIAGNAKHYGQIIETTHDVPAGKTLYITQVGFYCLASVAANADMNQMCYAQIDDLTDVKTYYREGGNGGGGMALTQPIVIPSGHTFHMSMWPYVNHDCETGMVATGYEV